MPSYEDPDAPIRMDITQWGAWVAILAIVLSVGLFVLLLLAFV
jgi:hypothetical protein